MIAENLYSQCDSEGRRFNVLEEIVDHRITKDALHGDDAYRTLNNGQRVPKRTTKGHQLLLRFRGNETEWMDLQTVKDSNPVEAAEYAVANQLDKEPAFAWWVQDVLRHKKRILSKVKSRHWKTTHKYGIRLPHSVEEAL